MTTTNKNTTSPPDPRTASVPEHQRRVSGARDPILFLRLWGTRTTYELPPDQTTIAIGTDPRASEPRARLAFPGRPLVSRHHCTLRRHHGELFVKDHSRNGTTIDDVAVSDVPLAPGCVLTLGQDLSLIAMSTEAQRVEWNLQRYLGYGERFQPLVDLALNAAVRRRHVLVRAPEGGQPVPFAKCLHDAWATATRPLVEEPFVPARKNDQRDLLGRAKGGTLMVPIDGLPPVRVDRGDGITLLEDLANPVVDVRLIVLADLAGSDERLGAAFGATTRRLQIPSLAERADELDEIRHRVYAEIEPRVRRQFASVGKWVSILPDIQDMHAYRWPGNLDELEHTIGVLMVLRSTSYRKAEDLTGYSRTGLSDLCKRLGLPTHRKK